jgi:glycyl-tRNA synthetase beta chain
LPEFLLEVGCEEIPAGWLAGLMEQLRRRFEEAAGREHLAPSGVRAFATPRRLVVSAQVLERQPDREERAWGPALKLAKDAAGKWTKAAEGFARKSGTAPEGLQYGPKDEKAPDDLYLYHVKKTPGRPARDVLPGALGALLRSLAFPKRMSWDARLDDGKGALPFGRPIRWLVAVLDGVTVPFTIHGDRAGEQGDPIVRSGEESYGHRFLPRGSAGGPIRARSLSELESGLRKHCVLIDPAAREARIADGLQSLAGGASRRDDHGLIAEWRDLVEYPTVVVGRVPAEFHSLPVEVLETVLVHHQKYLPLAEGGVVSRFAAVTDTDGSAADTIVKGMERVVVARLRDAAFFYGEDSKRPLATRVADLSGVTFHQKLGTYLDKTDRVLALVDAMGAGMGVLTKSEHEAAREAARLAKADLTTLMVREFPELQGTMGAVYLRAEGHPRSEVVAAIRWHYHPVSIEEGSAPAQALAGAGATVFAAVSLADKLDTLAGYFAVGEEPTGSRDPYGLRRAAQAVVRILLDFWNVAGPAKRPSLRTLVARAAAGYGALAGDGSKLAASLEPFLLDRLHYVLVSRGYPADEVDAVLRAQEPDALDDPHEAWVRVKALHRVRAEAREDFEHLAVAFKRANNILEQAGTAPGPVDDRLLAEAAERELHAAIRALQGTDGDYESRLRSLAALRAPIDRFFDDVLVMDPDLKLQAARLGLLRDARTLFYRIADISKLGG